MGRQAAYEQAVAWKVMSDDGAPHCLALMLVNWAFV
jgi:homeobox-leucine zipper protein